MDLVKSLAFGSGTGFAFGYSAASQWSGIVNLFLMGGNLSYALKILLGGVLSNYLFLVFAAIGGFQLVHRTDKVGRFCLSSLILASIWLPISNAWALHRIALVVPFSALAATGVGAVASGLEKRASRRVASLFIALVLLSSISFAFRSTVNLVPVGPL